MGTRLTVTLEQAEYSALLEVAEHELRGPADQARFVIRQDLERRGLMKSEPKACSREVGRRDTEE